MPAFTDAHAEGIGQGSTSTFSIQSRIKNDATRIKIVYRYSTAIIAGTVRKVTPRLNPSLKMNYIFIPFLMRIRFRAPGFDRIFKQTKLLYKQIVVLEKPIELNMYKRA